MDRRQALLILDQVRAKHAGDTAQSVQQLIARRLSEEALGDVANVALIGTGVGMAGRGAAGLYNVLHRNLLAKKRPKEPLAIVPVPIAEKAAGFWSGDGATSKTGIPWYRPAMVLGGLAGLYGGWKGIDTILDRRRKQEDDADVEEARREFAQALISQHERPMKLASDLDELFDAFQEVFKKKLEKTAVSLNPLNWVSDDTKGNLAGLYGVYALATGMPFAYAAYQMGKKRQRAAIVKDALRQREMRRQVQQPREVYALPMPTPGTPEDRFNTEESLVAN